MHWRNAGPILSWQSMCQWTKARANNFLSVFIFVSGCFYCFLICVSFACCMLCCLNMHLRFRKVRKDNRVWMALSVEVIQMSNALLNHLIPCVLFKLFSCGRERCGLNCVECGCWCSMQPERSPSVTGTEKVHEALRRASCRHHRPPPELAFAGLITVWLSPGHWTSEPDGFPPAFHGVSPRSRAGSPPPRRLRRTSQDAYS